MIDEQTTHTMNVISKPLWWVGVVALVVLAMVVGVIVYFAYFRNRPKQ